MRISYKRKMLLYCAISKPIVDLRILINNTEELRNRGLDEKLFDLEIKIADEVWKALNIKEE